jgi:hypothetical protein
MNMRPYLSWSSPLAAPSLFELETTNRETMIFTGSTVSLAKQLRIQYRVDGVDLLMRKNGLENDVRKKSWQHKHILK